MKDVLKNMIIDILQVVIYPLRKIMFLRNHLNAESL